MCVARDVSIRMRAATGNLAFAFLRITDRTGGSGSGRMTPTGRDEGSALLAGGGCDDEGDAGA